VAPTRTERVGKERDYKGGLVVFEGTQLCAPHHRGGPCNGGGKKRVLGTFLKKGEL